MRLSLKALIRFLIICWLGFLLGVCSAADSRPERIVVALDDNYPPYVFRDGDGQLKGFLIDLWALWSKKTSIAVEIKASDWSLAQQHFAADEADVLDTVSVTSERQKNMIFSPPYADLAVPIFVHNSIQGIDSTATLKAFAVGVKAGDACIERLTNSGVMRLDTYPSYEALVNAALAGEVRIFCLDAPPAHFLLARAGASQEFRQAFTLYTGQFHRAVKIGRNDLLATVNSGFSAISNSEYADLHDKWMGVGLPFKLYGKTAAYLLLLALGLGLLLLGWNFLLRRQVAKRMRELDAERQRLNTIVDGVGACIFIKGTDYRFEFANQAVCDVLNKPLKDILGQSDEAFFAAESVAKLRADDRRVIELGEELRHIEDRVILNSGETRSYLAIKVPMRNAAGKIVGLLGVSSDVTQQQRQEESLREVSNELEATLNAIPDLLFEVDETGLYLNIWANDARHLLLQKEVLLGRRLDEVMPPAAAKISHTALQEAAQNGRSSGHRIELPAPGGMQWYELSTALKPGDWQPRRFMVLSRNISDRMADQAATFEARADMQDLLAQADASRLVLLSIL